MSVTATVTFPSQPASGTLKYVPLGGNGYTDPFAMYQLKDFSVTGDATGGTASLHVIMDNRYCCMLAYASMTSAATGTDPMSIRWVWGSDTGGESPQAFRFQEAPVSPLGFGSRVSDTWVPQAFMQGSDPVALRLSVASVNEDTDAVVMHAVIYLYNINARNRVPMSQLVKAQGSSGNSSSGQ